MHRYSLKHLSNEVLRRELSTAAARERGATADLLAHIAEFDRPEALPAGRVRLDVRLLRWRAEAL
jgi:hypothetical protein